MPLRQLFTKREQHFYAGVRREVLTEKAGSFWSQSQFIISYPSMNQIHAEHVTTKLGLRQIVDIWIFDSSGNIAVDLMFSATLGDEEAVVGAIGAVILLPVAVAVGAVSYVEYENDAGNLISAFWSYLNSLVISGGGNLAAAPIAAPVESAPSPSISCAKCGQPLDADARFCKRCGEQVPGR